MLEQIGINGLVFNYGIFIALIPIIILSILSGFVGGKGNFLTDTKENQEAEEKNKLNYAYTAIFVSFLAIWYLQSFTIHWLSIAFSIVGGFVMGTLFVSNMDGLLEKIYPEKTISLKKSETAVLLIVAIFIALITSLSHVGSLSYDNILPPKERATLYVLANSTKAFDQGLDPDISPADKLIVYLYNQEEEEAKEKAIELLESLKRLNTYDRHKQSFYHASSQFLQGNYEVAEQRFQLLGQDTLSKVAKISSLVPEMELLATHSYRGPSIEHFTRKYFLPAITEMVSNERKPIPLKQEVEDFQVDAVIAQFSGSLLYVVISIFTLVLTVKRIQNKE